jgi:predicted O-linked N-acetylglucosamine transferase (SPINDLY family)
MELHAFYNNSECDALTERLKLRCASWTSIVGVPDKQAAQLMYEAKLDVLLDLSGHTGGNRLPVFAWRPAPVQATWLGYWASTGVAEIDYILADAHCVPAGSEGNFSEQVWRLPDTRMCFTAPCPLYESLPSPLPALRQGGITFASYQPVLKMNDAVLQTWGRVMQELPNARLRLQSWGLTEPNTQAEILQRLAMAGIAPERVSLHGGQAPQQYLRSHDEADIILDTFPYAAGTTTCNALWMGVPTVTLAGNSMLARQGVSLMGCSGLSDWVANTEDEYVAIAVKQASDVPKLAKLRAGLRQQVFESALMDAPLFAKNLEHCLYAMVQDKLAR